MSEDRIFKGRITEKRKMPSTLDLDEPPDPVPSLSAPAWTIYPCPVHGLAHGPDQTVMPLHNYCWRCDQMREGPSSYPANPVRVVPRERAEKAERELAECKRALQRIVDRDWSPEIADDPWEHIAREVLDRGVF